MGSSDPADTLSDPADTLVIRIRRFNQIVGTMTLPSIFLSEVRVRRVPFSPITVPAPSDRASIDSSHLFSFSSTAYRHEVSTKAVNIPHRVIPTLELT